MKAVDLYKLPKDILVKLLLNISNKYENEINRKMVVLEKLLEIDNSWVFHSEEKNRRIRKYFKKHPTDRQHFHLFKKELKGYIEQGIHCDSIDYIDYDFVDIYYDEFLKDDTMVNIIQLFYIVKDHYNLEIDGKDIDLIHQRDQRFIDIIEKHLAKLGITKELTVSEVGQILINHPDVDFCP